MMYFTINAALYCGALLVGMLVCLWALSGLAAVETAVFGLYGLPLAFTCSGAPTRLDRRKQLIADDANAINTAYLRLDLLPERAQPAMRHLNSGLGLDEAPKDLELIKNRLAKSTALQNDAWIRAVACSRLPGFHEDAAKLLLPALNQMIDITTTRTNATLIHPPANIYPLMWLAAHHGLRDDYGDLRLWFSEDRIPAVRFRPAAGRVRPIAVELRGRM
jgi:hypothetical protein